jgi:hypothetical protein
MVMIQMSKEQYIIYSAGALNYLILQWRPEGYYVKCASAENLFDAYKIVKALNQPDKPVAMSVRPARYDDC